MAVLKKSGKMGAHLGGLKGKGMDVTYCNRHKKRPAVLQKLRVQPVAVCTLEMPPGRNTRF